MPEIKTPATSRFFYRKMGTGPALVLIHGFPESSDLWRYVWEDLSGAYTLLIPDLPGSGNTPLEQDTSLAEMAECISLMLINEGISSAVIAGHSMGGYIAFEFAARYPLQTAGLSIIHSTPAADDEEKVKARLKSINLIENGGKSVFIRQMVSNLFADRFKQEHPEIVEEQIVGSLQVEEKALVNYYRAMIARNDHAALPAKVQFPIQWVLGMEDNLIFYKKIVKFFTLSPINFVSFYNNCGHMSMLEYPGLLINDLRKFIAWCYEPHD